MGILPSLTYVIFLLYLLPTALGLQCYECTERIDLACHGKNALPKKFITKCGEDQEDRDSTSDEYTPNASWLCISLKIVAGSINSIDRSCIEKPPDGKDVCEMAKKTQKDILSCITCTNDLCNGVDLDKIGPQSGKSRDDGNNSSVTRILFKPYVYLLIIFMTKHCIYF